MGFLSLALLKQYWKPLAIGGAVLALWAYTYTCAVHRTKQAQERAAAKEVVKRTGASRQEQDRINRTKERLRQPRTDERDSCILSNDPFTKECD